MLLLCIRMCFEFHEEEIITAYEIFDIHVFYEIPEYVMRLQIHDQIFAILVLYIPLGLLFHSIYP